MNGWQRLWVFFGIPWALIWLFAILVSGEEPLHLLAMAGGMVGGWALVYAVGWGIGWVIRGFRQ